MILRVNKFSSIEALTSQQFEQVVICGSNNGYIYIYKVELCAQNMLTILGLIINKIGDGGGDIRTLEIEHKNSHFDNE